MYSIVMIFPISSSAKMLTFTYVDYLLPRQYFKINNGFYWGKGGGGGGFHGQLSLPIVNRPSGRSSHGLPSYLPSFS